MNATTAGAPARPVPDITVTDVLVPLDGSSRAEAAVPYAAALAAGLDARVHLLTVGGGAGENYLNSVVRTRVHGPATTVEVADGHPAIAIAHRVGPHTLVCMRTHARGRFEQAVLGSVAHEVLRRTGRPALLIGPHADHVPWPTSRIVLALDGSPLADQAAEVAAAWAARLDVPIHVVTVIAPLPPDALGSFPPDLVESGHVSLVAQRLAAQGLAVTWEVLHGPDPAAAIAEYADAERGTLIVLSTHGRTGLRAVTAGSVATRVVHTAKSPVLALRPAAAEIPAPRLRS